MMLGMNEVETRHVQVLIRAIDTELNDLSIWAIPRPQNLVLSLIILGELLMCAYLGPAAPENHK